MLRGEIAPALEGVHGAPVFDPAPRAAAGPRQRGGEQAPLASGFITILLSYALIKLADALTTLAWMTAALGAPAFVVGFVVPLREAGSMIPQALIGPALHPLTVRKWVWVVGNVVQAACVAGFACVAIAGAGSTAGGTLVVLILGVSLARGCCSLAAKDVMGKTIPSAQRGQLTGWSASAAGVAGIVLGGALLSLGEGGPEIHLTAAMLFGASALSLIGSIIYCRVPEPRGERARPGPFNAYGQLRLLWRDQQFRRFVVARGLLTAVALSAPFYMALASAHGSAPAALIGSYIVATGCANLLSGPLWGRLADRSSGATMAVAGGFAALLGLGVAAMSTLAPQWLATGWCVPGAFFALCIAHNGVRVGRKTHVVDMATGNRRTQCVALSNAIIGVVLLLLGPIGLVALWVGNAGVIALLAIMAAGGGVVALGLPQVQPDETHRG